MDFAVAMIAMPLYLGLALTEYGLLPQIRAEDKDSGAALEPENMIGTIYWKIQVLAMGIIA